MIKISIFNFWKKKEPTRGYSYAPTMGGNNPFYSSFGDNIYASDIIVQSIRCKANEFKKLQPRHIRRSGDKQSVVTDSSIAKVLQRPNKWMTQSDFLEKITILRELNKNVFIYPEYYITKGGERFYTALYPLKPSTVEYLVNERDDMYIKLGFANGYETILPVGDIIHWRKDYGVNDYFGGSINGNDDKGLLTMLQRYDQLTQSIAKALECSCQINGVMKYNSYLDDDATKKAREEFESNLKSNKSGILFADLKTEYTHIPRDVKLVDSATLQFFYDTILRANGTPLAILNGDYTKAQKEAYYEHALESDIKSLGEAVSKVVFSDREFSFGNEIIFYPNMIEFMSMENKIAYMQVAVPAGAMSVNQILAFGGLPPVDGGDEIRPRGFNNLDGNTDSKESDDTVDETGKAKDEQSGLL